MVVYANINMPALTNFHVELKAPSPFSIILKHTPSTPVMAACKKTCSHSNLLGIPYTDIRPYQSAIDVDLKLSPW